MPKPKQVVGRTEAHEAATMSSSTSSADTSKWCTSEPTPQARTLSRSTPSPINLRDMSQHLEPAICRSLTSLMPPCTNVKHSAALQYFLEVPAPKVGFSKFGTFFTVTLPQAVWTHPAIMESMIALATMCASLRGTSTSAWTRHSPAFHYSQAIGALARSKPARHVTLLVCMLLWLYEQFDNQHMRAIFHRESGAKLLAEWRASDLGRNRTTDDYIASSIEPAFLTGFKVTAPVKLCREVMAGLAVLIHCPIKNNSSQCTYDEALGHLRACIEDFLDGRAWSYSAINNPMIRTALASLRTWDHQFQHYTGSTWATEGPVLLSYATTVAMLVQKTGLVQNNKDADWHRSLDFLLEETASGWCGIAHHSLLEGAALVAGE